MPTLTQDEEAGDQGIVPKSVTTTFVQPTLPAPPEPSSDRGIYHESNFSAEGCGKISEASDIDIFSLPPVTALRLLCSSVDDLVRITGNIPPTPPVNFMGTPIVPFLQVEKEGNSWHEKSGESIDTATRRPSDGPDHVDGVPMKKTPIGSPETGPTESLNIGSNAQSLYVQYGAITRKFYSKKPPSIALEEYLLRLHRYCPMSTAVYLATGLYIRRLAVTERIIPVTSRNAHRLLLAGLRVAMKALEDLSYPHRRFAKVGGVSEPELGRLEVSFCFLTNFELKVDKEMLHEQVVTMKDGAHFHDLPLTFQPILPIRNGKSEKSISQNTVPSVKEVPVLIAG